MWGVRGARLWRSLEKIKRGSRGSQEPRWQALGVCLRNLSQGKIEISNVASRASPNAGLGGGWLQDGKQFKSLPIWQQKMGITSKAESCKEDAGDQLVRSPLSQAPGPVDGAEGVAKTAINPKKDAQAVLTYIKQSPKKVNLVAELVRGMRVDDALMQLAVSTKRAAKVVAKVMTSARANATHNHGLDKDKLIVAEAFVGKDKYLKRLRIHGKGKAGKMVHPRCRLTIILKELSPEKEAKLARLRVLRSHGRKIHGSNAKLAPHRVIQTQWQWSRKRVQIERPSS